MRSKPPTRPFSLHVPIDVLIRAEDIARYCWCRKGMVLRKAILHGLDAAEREMKAERDAQVKAHDDLRKAKAKTYEDRMRGLQEDADNF